MKIVDLGEVGDTSEVFEGTTYFLNRKEKSELGDDYICVTIGCSYEGVYGLGERFDSINQRGKRCINQVKEQFCNQGDFTYCSVPFCVTDKGLGILIDTLKVSAFDFTKDSEIKIECPKDAKLVFFTGSIEEIIVKLNKYIGGEIETPPQFAFGPWISANHWRSERDVDKVLSDLKEFDFPATVMVLEAWSDEATFYIFNEASYQPLSGDLPVKYEDFDFSSSSLWNDPKAMIERLNKEGIHLVLWQIPVYKKMDPGTYNDQNALDWERAVKNRLCVFNEDGTPYTIPEGNWFGGSLIPDFTNEETKKDWFNKRQYLLDIGVDGFKTDGGEFIYKDDLKFSNLNTGREQKNAYSQTYVNSYKEFIGDKRVLFSRAGYTGVQKTPFIWAGDHQSTNDEFKHAFYSAISAACSGILFWSFDIAGFAGELPSWDLYLRSTAFACFCPVMQWHSEPDGGQFKEIMPGAAGNNERSPWNMAVSQNKEDELSEIRYWHKLRMKLLPYIYEEAGKACKSGIPMMRPLFWQANEDREVMNWEDEYMFGDSLLVAPLLEENTKDRHLYLPKGNWIGFFSGEEYEGNRIISSEKEKFPVFITKGRESDFVW